MLDNVDVNGTEITVGTNNSIFAENNIRFKSTGGAFIDHNTTGQSISFRTSVSSSLDTTPLVLSGANAFGGTVYATEFDLPSGGQLDWANGDARIVEGLVNNYSLSLQTWNGSFNNSIKIRW